VRGPHGLLRGFLAPLVEHPDEPVLRLLVVLGPHASFSPFAWKESLYQSQGSSPRRELAGHANWNRYTRGGNIPTNGVHSQTLTPTSTLLRSWLNTVQVQPASLRRREGSR